MSEVPSTSELPEDEVHFEEVVVEEVEYSDISGELVKDVQLKVEEGETSSLVHYTSDDEESDVKSRVYQPFSSLYEQKERPTYIESGKPFSPGVMDQKGQIPYDEQPPYCVQCNLIFEHYGFYEYHIAKDHLSYNPYECAYCMKRMYSDEEARYHLKTMHKLKPYRFIKHTDFDKESLLISYLSHVETIRTHVSDPRSLRDKQKEAISFIKRNDLCKGILQIDVPMCVKSEHHCDKQTQTAETQIEIKFEPEFNEVSPEFGSSDYYIPSTSSQNVYYEYFDDAPQNNKNL